MSKVEETQLFDLLPEEQKSWPVFSFSQIQMFNSCNFKWYLAYYLNFASPKGKALILGSLLHEALADYYFKKWTLGTTSDEWKENQLPIFAEEWLNSLNDDTIINASRALLILSRYMDNCEYYDQGHTILEVEKHFLVPFTTPQGRNFLLQGYIDLLTRDRNGKVWAWDHKSGNKHWTDNEVLMDPQLPFYIFILQNLGIDVLGQIINMISTYPYKDMSNTKDEQLFKRVAIYRTEREVNAIGQQMLLNVDQILSTKERLDTTGGQPLRHLRKDCGKYCTFSSPCSLGLKGLPIDEILKESFENKNKPKTKIDSISLSGPGLGEFKL